MDGPQGHEGLIPPVSGALRILVAMRKFAVLLALALPVSLAAQTINTDRPDQTESSAVVPAGSLQWECGFSSTWTPTFGGTVRELAVPNSLFRVSLHEKFELRVVHQLNRISDVAWGGEDQIAEGTSDVEMGTKIQLWQREGSRTEIAYLGHAVLPTGDPDLNGSSTGMVNKLCISHDVGPDWALGYNVGYDIADEQGTFTYALAIGKTINDEFGVYFEPYGEMANGVHLASFDAGLTLLSSDQWQWDISYGTGINHRMNYTAVGFSWLVLPSR